MNTAAYRLLDEAEGLRRSGDHAGTARVYRRAADVADPTTGLRRLCLDRALLADDIARGIDICEASWSAS